jgi:YHS domain-containing protein
MSKQPNSDDTTAHTACGSEVLNKDISINYQEKTLYFCESECLNEFVDNPEKFIRSDHFLISFSSKKTRNRKKIQQNSTGI